MAAQNPIKLKLTVSSAKNLFNADARHARKKDVSDPYVKVWWQSGRPEDFGSSKKPAKNKVGKTKVVKNDLNPVWENEVFEFEVPDLDVVVHLEVYDKDTLSRDDYLGEGALEVWEHVTADYEEETVWMQLFNAPSQRAKFQAQGSLRVLLSAHNLPAVVYDTVELIGAPEHGAVEGFNEMLEKYVAEHPEVSERMKSIERDAQEAKARFDSIEARSTKHRDAIRKSAEDMTLVTASASSSSAESVSGSTQSATQKARQMLQKSSRVSSADLPVELCYREKADSQDECGKKVHQVPCVRVPRLRRKLVKDSNGCHRSSTVLVGAAGIPVEMASSEAYPEEADRTAHEAPAHNPWETPKKPPKKGTYDWHNWGDTIYVKPRKQWHPTSLQDLQEAIADAKAAGVTMRCVGHAHSWSPIFTDNGNDIVFTDKLVGMWKDLKSMDPKDWRVTVLAGTTTGDLASLLKKNSLYLPTNVISKLFIYGGLMSTGSHGSGWNEGLVLDYITQLQILDHTGKLRTFDRNNDDGSENPDWPYIVLNLGMYGIMYSITLRVLPALKRAKSIDYSIDMHEFWDTDLYSKVITESHYTELFWFPFNKKMWIKVWDFTDEHVVHRPITAMWHTFTQWLQSRVGHYINPLIASHNGHWPLSHDFWRDLTPAYLRAAYGMLEHQMLGSLKKPKESVHAIPDAIHWREFLDAMPVWNTEIAIDLPEKEDGSTDLSPAKESWEYFCKLIDDVADGKVDYGHENRYPCNVTLEARFGGKSVAALGNNHGNNHTIWIEWVTGVYTPGWKEFSNYMMKHCYDKYPSARSHWAKYQQDYPNIIDVKRERMGDRWQKFVEIRNKYEVDPDNMFTTSWLRALFGLQRPQND